jgi:hypothetical protein
MTRRLYHFTCLDHGDPGILRTGFLRPHPHPSLPELGPVVWLTEIAVPTHPYDLGLTSDRLSCDRMAVRYTLAHEDVPGLRWWPIARRACDPKVVRDLDSFGRPLTWWVATERVPVDLATRQANGAAQGPNPGGTTP